MLSRLYRPFRRFLNSERGATAVEYVLLASAVAGAIAIIVFGFGEVMVDLINELIDSLDGPG